MRCSRRNSLALLAAAFNPPAPAAVAWTRLVVPSTAGTVSHKLAHALSAGWPEHAGQPLVALERAGGGGTLALQEVARGPTDGSVLLLANTGTSVVRPELIPSNSADALIPLIKLASAAGVLVANRNLPAATWPEFIGLARRRPGHWSYASAGVGSLGHLVTEALCVQAGIRLLHVPYKSSAEPLSDLLEGRVQLLLLSIGATLPLALQGRVKALALGSSARSLQLPRVPTFSELGYEGADIDNWQGLFVHRDVDPATRERLHNVASGILRDTSFRHALHVERLEPAPVASPAAFAELLSVQRRQVRSLILSQRLRLI